MTSLASSDNNDNEEEKDDNNNNNEEEEEEKVLQDHISRLLGFKQLHNISTLNDCVLTAMVERTFYLKETTVKVCLPGTLLYNPSRAALRLAASSLNSSEASEARAGCQERRRGRDTRRMMLPLFGSKMTSSPDISSSE